MSKQPTKSAEQPKSETPKAIEAIAEIANVVLAYRDQKPTLADVARIADRASGLLRLKAEEKAAIANNATIHIARERGLVS